MGVSTGWVEITSVLLKSDFVGPKMDVWVFGSFLLHLCILWGLRFITTFKAVLESLPSL